MQSCEICQEYSKDTRYCKAPVIFPDSTYSRSSGMRRTMDKNEGGNCPAYKEKVYTLDELREEVTGEIFEKEMGNNKL